MNIKLIKRPPEGAELWLEGRLDASSAPEAEQVFLQLSDQYRDLVLDFTNLAYVSSAGFRTMVALQKKMSKAGGMLTLTHISPAIMEVFEMTGLSGIMNIR